MRIKLFSALTLLTLLFYGFLRIIGWGYFNQTNSWRSLNNDYWHHWQLGILLLLIAFVFSKNWPIFKDILLAVGSGQIIDELTYAIFSQENISQFNMMLKLWYKPLVFEMLLFITFSLLVYKIKLSDKETNKYPKYLLIIFFAISITILMIADLGDPIFKMLKNF